MKGSWKLFDLAGIGVHVHWSFLLLPAVVGFSALLSNGIGAAVQSVLFILALFGCVTLHELGHALAARRFGIRTQDITLLPIGGLARLERMPRNPWQELAIALAGPAVNVAIAVVLLVALWASGGLGIPFAAAALGGAFIAQLIMANIGLVIFNMLPAFPMDGGRVLRSLLAMWLPYLRATEIAAKAGQLFAILFAVVGIVSGHLGLLLVAGFVFLAARSEVWMARSSIPQSSLSQAGHSSVVDSTWFRESPEDIVYIDPTQGDYVAGSRQVAPTQEVLLIDENGAKWRYRST